MLDTSEDQIAPASATVSFIGFNAYTEENAAAFFGRDKEIASLCRMIKANTLTSVFGKSGTGKTSLLNAGVFPKLSDDNYLPFRIRLEFKDDSPPLKKQVWNVLEEKISKLGYLVSPPVDDETLWEYFHREDLWKIVTPILVFDQFEEIFTLAPKWQGKQDDVENLVIELADLIENTIPETIRQRYLNSHQKIAFNYKNPRAKIIFSFREDFLPEMETITAKIPSVKNSRFRLTPMNGHQAYEVITKTWKANIEAAEARKIVYYLTNEIENIDYGTSNSDFNLLEIEPSLLSQVCTYLEKEREQDNDTKISAEFLKKYPKGIILSSIYHKALDECIADKGLQDDSILEERNLVKVFIEEHLITEEGYRTKYNSSELLEAVKPGVENLKRKYFLREEGPSIEITHDVIATLVKYDRDERRRLLAIKEANTKGRKRILRILAIAAALALIVVLASAGMATYYGGEAVKSEAKVAEADATYNDLQGKIDSAKKDFEKVKRNNTAAGQWPKPDKALLDSLNKQLAEYAEKIETLENENMGLKGRLAQTNNPGYDPTAHYETIIADQNRLLDHYKKRLDDFAYWKDRQTDFLVMYQSHIDRIIKYRNSTDSLQHHIDLLQQHRNGFKEKLGF